MAHTNWLSSLWLRNLDRKFAEIDQPRAAGTQPFEQSRHEFMFDSLMDIPLKRINTRRDRSFEKR